MMSEFSTRIKRAIAFVIDWNLCFLPGVLVTLLLSMKMEYMSDRDALVLLLILLLDIALSLALFVTKDFIMGGRSLGKRMLGLVVVDKATLQKPRAVKLLFRGMFFFIMEVDGLIVLITGNSIYDMAFGTLVLSKKELEIANGERMCQVKERKPLSATKIVIIVMSFFLAFVICVVGVVLASLNSAKKTEEYAVAYDYLVNTDEFKSSCASPERLFMNSYSRNTYYRDGVRETTVTMGFKSGFFTSYTVVCHADENGAWYVCDECTPTK